MSQIIDCHAHLETRTLDVPSMLRKMDAQGIHRAVLIARITEETEPAKSGILLSLQRWMMTSDTLRPVAQMVSRTFYDQEGALRKAWKPFTTGGKGYQKTQVPDNPRVAEVVAQHPDRFWGWIFVNPKSGDCVEEIEKWRSRPGMIGIKIHPYWHAYSLQRIREVFAYADTHRLPVLVHMGFGGQGDFAWVASEFPDLKMIFAHAAIPYFKKAWPLIREKKNFCVDLSSPHLSEAFSHKVIRVLGAGKCLYGSDAPYGFLNKNCDYDYSATKGWIERAPASAKEKEGMLGENFLKLLRD